VARTKLDRVGPEPTAGFPLGSERPDAVRTPSGLSLDELTLDALRAGRLRDDDMRATADTLRLQAEVARAAGRGQLADNLARAAELTALPDEVILEIYTALRPHRATREQLDGWADRLDHEYTAPLTATFVRDASVAYAERGFLSVDERPGTAAV
jgi:propanediol dehydratase small subunit